MDIPKQAATRVEVTRLPAGPGIVKTVPTITSEMQTEIMGLLTENGLSGSLEATMTQRADGTKIPQFIVKLDGDVALSLAVDTREYDMSEPEAAWGQAYEWAKSQLKAYLLQRVREAAGEALSS